MSSKALRHEREGHMSRTRPRDDSASRGRLEGPPEGAAVSEGTEAHRSPRWYAIVCVSCYFVGGRVWAHAGPCFSSQTMKNKCIFLHKKFTDMI